MRRKSARNASKSSPEKVKKESPTRKSKRQSRRRKKSASDSSENSEDEKPIQEIEQEPPAVESAATSKSHTPSDEEAAPTPEQPVWKITPSNTPTGEIQKLKICLTRPIVQTPERPSRRHKKSHTQEDDSPDEKRRRRRTSGSPAVTEGSQEDEKSSELDEKEEKKGKGKSKGKHKSKIEKSAKNIEPQAETSSEISENVQVTAQSPTIDIPVDNVGTEVENCSLGHDETTQNNNVQFTETKEEDAEINDKEVALNDVSAPDEPEADTTATDIVNISEPAEVMDHIQINEVNTSVTDQEVEVAHMVDASVDSELEKETSLHQNEASSEDQQSGIIDSTPAAEDDSAEVQVESQSGEIYAEIEEQSSLQGNEDNNEPNEERVMEQHLSLQEENKGLVEQEQSLQSVAESDSNLEQPEEAVEEIVASEGVAKQVEEESNESEKSESESSSLPHKDESHTSPEEHKPESTDLPDEESEIKANKTITEQMDVDISESDNFTRISQQVSSTEEKVDNTTEGTSSSMLLTASNKKVLTGVDNKPSTRLRKRKWGSTNVGLKSIAPRLVKIDIEDMKNLNPELTFLEENEVKLDSSPPERRKSSERKPPKMERKVSIEEPEERPIFRTQTSTGSTKSGDGIEDNSHIIALNRKISIVDDTASKLKPPPSPAKNPISEVLFITNLVRPFTLKQLKELLERTGKIKEEGFWTDRIKSKCYVHYETVEEAEATRTALHGVQWPVGNGKKLIIEYATTEELEKAKNPPAPPAPAVPVIEEPKIPEKENEAPVSPPRRREEERDRRKETHVREWDIGKEELNRNRDRSKSRDRHDRKRHTHRSTTPLDDFISRKQRKLEEQAPQKLMDDLFQKTKATPCIYWQPLSPEEIATKQQQRLMRMAEHKRRMEESSRNRGSDFGRGGAYRRRYD